jgi:hypothetical protein
LTDQSAAEVEAHTEALKRDRTLTRHTLDAIRTTIQTAEAEIANLNAEFHSAQRALEDVSAAAGPVREQIVRAASDLASEERRIERLDSIAVEIQELQSAIDAWLLDAQAARIQTGIVTDIEHRKAVFIKALGDYLLALGHSAAVSRGVDTLRFEEGQYEPYLGYRRLRALGSGSDPARLVAAYSLALAAASTTLHGLHPGVVILDEPLQQNPDTKHVKLFLDFLSRSIAKEASFQTIVFTFLNESQVQELRGNGTTVVTLDGHLLGLVDGKPASDLPN